MNNLSRATWRRWNFEKKGTRTVRWSKNDAPPQKRGKTIHVPIFRGLIPNKNISPNKTWSVCSWCVFTPEVLGHPFFTVTVVDSPKGTINVFSKNGGWFQGYKNIPGTQMTPCFAVWWMVNPQQNGGNPTTSQGFHGFFRVFPNRLPGDKGNSTRCRCKTSRSQGKTWRLKEALEALGKIIGVERP